jgi:hypothetical protein
MKFFRSIPFLLLFATNELRHLHARHDFDCSRRAFLSRCYRCQQRSAKRLIRFDGCWARLHRGDGRVVVRVFVAWTEVAVSCAHGYDSGIGVSRRRRRLSQLCVTTPPGSLRSPRWPRVVGPVCIGPINPAPDPKLVKEGRPNTTFASATSDTFFERPENRVRAQGSQRALIDGDHSFAKALRNFENLEALAAPNSIIAIHDVVPMTWMPER